MINRCGVEPKSCSIVEMDKIRLLLSSSRDSYPFRITNWNDSSRSKLFSFFVSLCDESRYQSGDSAGTFGRKKKR